MHRDEVDGEPPAPAALRANSFVNWLTVSRIDIVVAYFILTLLTKLDESAATGTCAGIGGGGGKCRNLLLPRVSSGDADRSRFTPREAPPSFAASPRGGDTTRAVVTGEVSALALCTKHIGSSTEMQDS